MVTHPHDVDRVDIDTFETELVRLVGAARNDDSPIEGTYDVRTPYPDEADYTVEISEIAKRTFPPRPRDDR